MSWKRLSRDIIYQNKYFTLNVDSCETADGRTVPRYFVLDFPDWVQIVATNEDGELILVDQYRYPGANKFLEFAGGSTHPDRKEEPLAAAKRELLEETGYASEEWKYLGAHYANPALQVNRCHTFFAANCKKVAELNLDPFEELTVRLMKPREFISYSREMNPHHSLILASLFLALPYLE